MVIPSHVRLPQRCSSFPGRLTNSLTGKDGQSGLHRNHSVLRNVVRSAQRDMGSGDTEATMTRRRVIALAEVSLELGVAAWCELNFRPKAPGDAQMSLSESLGSLLPYKTPEEERREAKVFHPRSRSTIRTWWIMVSCR